MPLRPYRLRDDFMPDEPSHEPQHQGLRVDQIEVEGLPSIKLSIMTSHSNAHYIMSRDEARRLSRWLKGHSRSGFRRRSQILLGQEPALETDRQLYERGMREGLRRAAELIEGNTVLEIVAGSSVIIPQSKRAKAYDDAERPQNPWVKFLREQADIVDENPKRSCIGVWLAQKT